MTDLINHPPHYTAHPSGVECIEITEHMGFNLGNAVKYIWRADLKGNQLADLEKAAWYIQREISRINGASEPEPTEWTDAAINAMVDAPMNRAAQPVAGQFQREVDIPHEDACRCYSCRILAAQSVSAINPRRGEADV